MTLFSFIFFFIYSFQQIIFAEEKEENNIEDVFHKEEYQDLEENSYIKRHKFISFKPFSCCKMYFSLTHESLFFKKILGFNGYFLHSIYDIKKNGFCFFGLEQFIVFLNILGSLGGVVSPVIIFGLEYFFEILKIFIPKFDFLLGYYGNFKFFYRINYDFGMRMIAYQNKNEVEGNVLVCKSKNFKIFNNSEECIICKSALNSGDLLGHDYNNNGSHVFHKDCLEAWYNRQQTCPICRIQIKIADVTSIFSNFFYFDLLPEFYIEYSSNVFSKKVKPFVRLLLGGGVKFLAKYIDEWYILPKVYGGVEGGLRFSNKYEILISFKPTYVFRTQKFGLYDDRHFLFDCALTLNLISSFQEKV